MATAAVLLALVACDIWVAGVRTWWDRHSFTSCVLSSLLVLGVTVLIVDEVMVRRQRKERAGSVAVQALIVYGQALRSCDAVAAMAVASASGAGPGGEEPPGLRPELELHDEVRSLASMILVASPSLFEDPEARLFLEEVQRLAGMMYGALAQYKMSPAPPTGEGERTVAHLRTARSKVDARVGPLAARLADEDRARLEAAADLAAQRLLPTSASATGG